MPNGFCHRDLDGLDSMKPDVSAWQSVLHECLLRQLKLIREIPAVLCSGGLTAPDPNRPFQSRPSLTPPQARADTGTSHADAARQSNTKRQQGTAADQPTGQQQSKAASNGSQAGRPQSGGGLGASSRDSGGHSSVKGGQSNPQNRLLAKLGLSKGGQLSRPGPQANKVGACLPSNNPPSGETKACHI